jgi:predicted kinase
MLARADRGGGDDAATARAASDYFALAQRLIAPPAPRLIAVGGHSGTGKSVLAKGLAGFIAPAPGAVVLRSDLLRKRLFNVGETDRLPPEAYQPEVTATVYRGLAERAERILKQGRSVIVDAVFAHEPERDAIAAVAALHAARFDGVYLTADLATRVSRIDHRRGDASDATAEIARLQESFDGGTMQWPQIDASGTPEQTLLQSMTKLGLDPAKD